MKVGIIGAGIAGIATAIRMASRGHEVVVFEANTYPGGKLSTFDLEGFRFDAGPSLFTMPQYVEELFKVAGKPIKGRFEYERLEVLCHYFWEDGTKIHAFAEGKKFANEVAEKLQVPAENVLNTLADSERKYHLTGRIFLEKSLHRFDTWWSASVLKAIFRIPSLDLFRSMYATNKRLLNHEKLVQLFNRYATYNGSNPYKAPGLLTIIPHFEYGFGAYFPKGGMYSITNSLYELAVELGVRFHFGQKVEEIEIQQQRAIALKVVGNRHAFDRVVCNMDIFHAYKQLLPNQVHPHRILRQPKSTSALIFYWGIRQRFPQLDLHNILFSQDYKKEFNALDAGTIDDDPTIYINITSKYHAPDAPEGCENWFTMINVPCNKNQDWDALIAKARKNIVTKINRVLNTDIESLLVCEQILDPRSIESITQSH
ncbi:MAG: phytoene desaturase, partial [Saprospiraceae bacterium]|nr:phytoene desaturase [Saprospiraceae bacterium]